MTLSRRSFLTGLAAAAAAPAIVRATSLMPVKVMRPSGLLTVHVAPQELLDEWAHRQNSPIFFRTIADAVEFVTKMGAGTSEIILENGTYNETVRLPSGDHTLVVERGSYVEMKDFAITGQNRKPSADRGAP